MDFSKQLANLERTAANAASRNNNNTNNNISSSGRHSYHHHHGGGGRGGRGHHRRGGGGRSYYGRGHNSHHHGSGEEDNESSYYVLQRLISNIPKFQPVSVPKKEKRFHIALLFLTIDDLPYEHIWRDWLFQPQSQQKDDTDNNDVCISVVCHAKFPERVTSPWLQQRLLTIPPPRQRNNNNNNNNHYHHHRQHAPNTTSSSSKQQEVRYHSRRPEWGSIDITRAMMDLLEEALKIGSPRHDNHSDARYSTRRYLSTPSNTSTATATESTTTSLPSVDRFIFVSETCIPVSTVQEVNRALFGTTTNNNNKDGKKNVNHHQSWINAKNSPNNGYARQLQWDRISKSIPQDKIWKADQWICLTRHHAWPIVSLVEEAAQAAVQSQQQQQQQQQQQRRNNNNYNHHHHHHTMKPALWQCFKHVKASDEMYFPTAMSLLGILNPPTSTTNDEKKNDHEDEIAIRRITYCDWSMNAKNPASFSINRNDNFKELRQVIRLAREEGCLFARKFVCNSNYKNNHSSHNHNNNYNAAVVHSNPMKSNNDETQSNDTSTTTNNNNNNNDGNGECNPTETCKERKNEEYDITFEEWMEIVKSSTTLK